MNFKGYRMTIATSLYMFLAFGMMNVSAVAFAVFPEYFHTSMENITIGLSVCAVANFIFMFIAGEYLKKIGPRRAMIIGAFAVAAFGLTVAFVPSLIGFFIAQVIAAFAISTCMHACCTMVISNWFVEKRSQMVGICMSAGIFGGAAFQFVAGHMLSAWGCSKVYLVMGVAELIVLLFLSVVIIRDNPEAIGQKPLGWENAADAPKEETKPDVSAPQAPAKRSIYANPTFYLMAVGFFFSMLGFAAIATYLTTVLPTHGIELGTASMLLSIMSLGGGFVTFFMGVILEKLGLKPSIIMLGAALIIANIAMYFWCQQPSWALLLVVGIGFVIGNPIQTLSNLVAAPVFGDQAYLANPKLFAIANAGSAILLPMLSKLAMSQGFGAVYLVSVPICLLTVVPMLVSLKIAHK